MVTDTEWQTRRHPERTKPDRGRSSHTAAPAWGLAVRRLPLILAGVAACVLALQVSVAGAFRDTRPDFALWVAPLDARARVRVASAIIAADQSEQSRTAARELATDAFLRDPLQPAALRVVAQSLEMPNDPAQQDVTDLMLASHRLSRREGATQMWFIQHYARLGNVGAMFDHFDIYLQSSLSARPNLFPLLIAAADGPEMKTALLDRLKDEPDWARPFVEYAIRTGSDLRLASELAPLLRGEGGADGQHLYRILLERLTANGEFDLAWQVYGQVEGEAESSGTPRNGDFEAVLGLPPFGWSVSEEAGLWAARERGPVDGHLLRIGASSGKSGNVASQLLQLTPGGYLLEAQIGQFKSASFEGPEFHIRCAGNEGGELLQAEPAAGMDLQTVSAQFGVPANCPFQWLEISAAGDGALSDPLPWVDNVRITKGR